MASSSARKAASRRVDRSLLMDAPAERDRDLQAVAGDARDDVEQMGALLFRRPFRTRALRRAGEAGRRRQRLVELAEVVEADLGGRNAAERLQALGVSRRR